MALKSVQIVKFCSKLSGLADFENTVDRGSAVIFDPDSRLCLSYVQILGPNGNLHHTSFFILSHLMLMSSSKLFLFLNEAHLNSGIHCETVIVAVLCF